MNKFLVAYITAFFIFIIIDAIWISVVANDFYKNNLGQIIASSFKIIPALLFYLIYIFCIVYFAIIPGVKEANIMIVVINSFLLGLVCYATYDLTNYATLNDFSLKVVVVDMIWGTFLTTFIGTATYLIISKFFV